MNNVIAKLVLISIGILVYWIAQKMPVLAASTPIVFIYILIFVVFIKLLIRITSVITTLIKKEFAKLKLLTFDIAMYSVFLVTAGSAVIHGFKIDLQYHTITQKNGEALVVAIEKYKHVHGKYPRSIDLPEFSKYTTPYESNGRFDYYVSEDERTKQEIFQIGHTWDVVEMCWRRSDKTEWDCK